MKVHDFGAVIIIAMLVGGHLVAKQVSSDYAQGYNSVKNVVIQKIEDVNDRYGTPEASIENSPVFQPEN